jgi:hypothetical protein
MEWEVWQHQKKIKSLDINLQSNGGYCTTLLNTNPIDLQLIQRTYIYKPFQNLQQNKPPFFPTTRWRQLLYHQISLKSTFNCNQNYFLMCPTLSVVPVLKLHLK